MAVDLLERAKAKARALAAGGDAIDDEPEVEAQGPSHALDIEEPDDGEDDIDEPRPSRRERRRERGELHSALESTRAEAAALRAEKAALEARLASVPKPSEKTPEVDPIDEEIKKVYEEQDSLLTAWNAGADKFTEPQKADYKRRAQELEIRKGTLFAKKAGAGRQQAVDPLQTHRAGLDIQTRAVYPDVYANQQALQYADLTLKRSIAAGLPDTIETWKAAAQEARERFGTAPSRRGASDADRNKFTAASRGSGGGEREPAKRTLNLSPEALAVAKRSAVRMYSKVRDPKTGKPLSEEQMLQRWVNRVGPRVLEQKRA